jgi:hypothetical protein
MSRAPFTDHTRPTFGRPGPRVRLFLFSGQFQFFEYFLEGGEAAVL